MVYFSFPLVSLITLSTLSLALPGNQQQDEQQNQKQNQQQSKQGSFKDHIKNVVVLVLENRSFDTIAGGLSYNPEIDGLLHHKFCNPVNVSDPSNHETVCAKPIAQNVAPDDPNHGTSGVNLQVYSTYHPTDNSKATMQGFVTEQATVYKTKNISRAAEAINYYTQDHVRVFADMASNYVLFDRWFAAVPGPTNPNRAYLTSGTSHGHGRNDAGFNTAALPQRSIFQQLSEKNISWINYSNTTGFTPDALFYSWTVSSGAATTHIKPLSQFYSDAQAGTLPQFTYLNPECCSYQSFHPPSPITDGEAFIKHVYESLRSSPQWDETLFILTFDEHGGFGDHVPPPTDIPAGDKLTYTEKAPDGQPTTFDFTRLGIRVPTLLISPWVGKGVVEKKGRNKGGEYDHTSILGFLANLWGLDTLTPRVGWSSTFEHLIEDESRGDTPTTLASAYPF